MMRVKRLRGVPPERQDRVRECARQAKRERGDKWERVKEHARKSAGEQWWEPMLEYLTSGKSVGGIMMAYNMGSWKCVWMGLRKFYKTFPDDLL